MPVLHKGWLRRNWPVVAVPLFLLVVLGLVLAQDPMGRNLLGQRPSTAAAAAPTQPSPTVSPTPSPTVPATTPAASPSAKPVTKEFCSQADEFCITLAGHGKPESYKDAEATTTSGTRRGRSYSWPDTGHWVMVYSPKEKQPKAALQASRDWSYSKKPTTFHGDPAILVIDAGDGQAKNDPTRNVVLKVAHGGKVYLVFSTSSPNVKVAKQFYNTLRFTNGE